MKALSGLSGLSAIAGGFNIKQSLLAFYRMEEASGQAVDAHAFGKNLTDSNTVGAGAGKVGSSRHFVRANSECFYRQGDVEFRTGDVDFVIATWAWFTDSSAQPIAAQIRLDPAYIEWQLYLDTNDNRIKFTFGPSSIAATSFGVPPTNTWIFIMAWHDAGADTINIQINNGTVNSDSTGGAIPNPVSDYFLIGSNNFSSTFMNGRVDQLLLRKSAPRGGALLVQNDRDFVWNAGNGLEY